MGLTVVSGTSLNFCIDRDMSLEELIVQKSWIFHEIYLSKQQAKFSMHDS